MDAFEKMRNVYLKNLCKIEFVVTNACTGHCKHCSEGDHLACGDSIDPTVAADAVSKIAGKYDIKTVMTFGGEPLLYPDTVCKIISAARDSGVPKRQVITNGYFSKNEGEIRKVAEKLSECGVNDLLLSVDAFHQETIPLATVKIFAYEAKRWNVPIRLSPAWLRSPEDDNPYNEKTREILSEFCDIDIPVGDGNIVFPEGNALKYLGEYFDGITVENPYVEDPCNVKCVSFSPNGDVLDGNFHKKDILRILEDYDPKR